MKIALDLDGTLLDTTVRQCFLLKAILTSFGQSIDTRELWSAKREGASNRRFLSDLQIDQTIIDEACDVWVDYIETPYWLSLDTLVEGVRSTLTQLVKCHEIELLTARRSKENLLSQLASKRMLHYFSAIRVVSPSEVIKNKSEVLIAERFDLFIGDSETDFFAAEKSNVRFLGVENGQRSKPFLLAAGVSTVFENLPELVAEFGIF